MKPFAIAKTSLRLGSVENKGAGVGEKINLPDDSLFESY